MYKNKSSLRKNPVNHDVESLTNTPLGALLSDDELEMLLRRCHIFELSRGDTFVEQGKYLEGFYLILEGVVSLKARTLGLEIAKIETLKAGDFVGEICFMEKVPCSASATAKSKTKCIYITSIFFDLLAAYFPETKYKILQTVSLQVSRRLKHIHDRITEFISQADMKVLSIFVRIIHSLTQPTKLVFDDDSKTKSQLFHSPLLAAFTEEEINELLEHISFLQAPKECTLIHEKDKSPACYIVLQGAVQSSVIQDNKMAKLSVIGPDSLLASIACIDRESDFTISYITCESSRLLKIPEESLLYLKDNKFHLWFKLYDLICHSISALDRSIDKLDIRLHIEAYNR